MEKTYDVFISYSRKDTAIADKVIKAFDAHGITYFIDRLGIAGGLEFPRVIAEAITSSTIFLFLGSRNSYDSKFTNSEITFAFNKKTKKSILPYIIDGSQLPINLEFVFSNINVRNMEEHPIDPVLIHDIKTMLGQAFEEPAFAKNTSTKNATKHLIVGTAIVAAIIVLGGGAMLLNQGDSTSQTEEGSSLCDTTVVNPPALPSEEHANSSASKKSNDQEEIEIDTDTYIGFVTGDNVCLRSEPNEASKMTGPDAPHFFTGNRLHVVRVVDNYYAIDYQGAEYFIPKKYLRLDPNAAPIEDVPEYVSVAGDNVCLRSIPNESGKMTGPDAPHLYKGEKYRCVGIENGYYAIRYGNEIYYLPMTYGNPL